jgi:hypothetical protein|tara:strand:+ start:2377 stop:2946 length:570 start_codon:yes stop_codon:yes gene_type:complete
MSTDQKEKTKKVVENIYVWGKTDRAGDIVTVDDTSNDPQFLMFTDGSKCNRELVGEMLLHARDLNEANMLSSGFNPGAITTNIAVTEKVLEPDAPKLEHVAEVNVMMEMLKKMSAKNHAEMPVKVNIPSKEVYDLFKDQMDITKKDLNDQIGLLVESQIDNLREQLKLQIESFIKNYYNESRTTKSDNA